MKVTVHTGRVYALLDTLVERWQKKQFPYNKVDAIIPQTIIPEELRADKKALATFYFYICIYMRGGIESLQAFQALLRMRHDHPDCFDPFKASKMGAESIQIILKEYIGWDSKAASKNWAENSWRLVWYWGGNPLELFKGIHDYEEALRRIRNKRTKADRLAAGHDGCGFLGFQPKMVSMLVYFLDWEKLLKPRFPYPSPADFHNFRLGLTTGGLEIPKRLRHIHTTEKLSAPWRQVVMEYIVQKKADPVEVADALWLFSLVMCGNSPLMSVREAENGSGMFSEDVLPHITDQGGYYLLPRFRNALEMTCLRCPIRDTCSLAIPSRPYYRKGLLVLRSRFLIENHRLTVHPDTPISRTPERVFETLSLLGPDTS